MMEIKIASRSLTDERGQVRTFHYVLLTDFMETDRFALEDYGVQITEEGGETSAIRGITVSAQRIDELMTLLVEHRVGPTALQDVVADWL